LAENLACRSSGWPQRFLFLSPGRFPKNYYKQNPAWLAGGVRLDPWWRRGSWGCLIIGCLLGGARWGCEWPSAAKIYLTGEDDHISCCRYFRRVRSARRGRKAPYANFFPPTGSGISTVRFRASGLAALIFKAYQIYLCNYDNLLSWQEIECRKQL
jgi:hypothetical protein